MSNCGVCGREVYRRPCNHEIPSASPRERVSTLGFFIGPHIRREYWCSSQEAESREISISCKNLFLNRCKVNMFKLNWVFLVSVGVTVFSFLNREEFGSMPYIAFLSKWVFWSFNRGDQVFVLKSGDSQRNPDCWEACPIVNKGPKIASILDLLTHKKLAIDFWISFHQLLNNIYSRILVILYTTQ